MRTFLVAVLVLATTFAGCTSDPNGADDPLPLANALPMREDSKTFTLGPRESIEWKFALSEGSTFEYVWSAGRPVYFDFHGDLDDGTDDFVSHKEATLASDQDTFDVPFTGRHGWFWSNGNSQTVTITLTTKGPYEVIGKTGGSAN